MLVAGVLGEVDGSSITWCTYDFVLLGASMRLAILGSQCQDSVEVVRERKLIGANEDHPAINHLISRDDRLGRLVLRCRRRMLTGIHIWIGKLQGEPIECAVFIQKYDLRFN